MSAPFSGPDADRPEVLMEWAFHIRIIASSTPPDQTWRTLITLALALEKRAQELEALGSQLTKSE